MRGRWFLLAALVLSLVGSVFLYVYLRQLDERVAVVVASRDLLSHEQLTSAEVKIAYIHPSAVLPDALSSIADADGRWMLHEALAGEQLTSAHLSLANAGAGSFGLGLAYRAVFIPCNYQYAAGGALWEGDHVDVVAVAASRAEPLAYRIAQDLEVLEMRDDEGLRIRASGEVRDVGGVLVAVPDVVADGLVLAMECGQVYLLLRDSFALPRPEVGP